MTQLIKHDAAMPDVSRSNSLTVLGAQIKAAHEAVGAALKDSVHHAITAGELLIEAKARISHGEWAGWLRNQCEFTERTAQRYMRLARNRAEMEAKTTCVSDLSLNAALALLTVPREPLDDSLVESVVHTLDASEELASAMRSMAETARRKVIHDASERELGAIKKIIDKWPPRSDGTHPLEDVWCDVAHDTEWVAAYGNAVEADNYERAFTLAEGFYKYIVGLRTLADAFDRGERIPTPNKS